MSHLLSGLYLLWKIGIAHGDISLNNMMYYEENGVLYGVLNDFDLAAKMEVGERSPKKQGFERTGTIPFMARDLLQYPGGRMTRWFRHDLESCMWCIVLHSLKHERVDLYTASLSSVSDKRGSIMYHFDLNFLKREWEYYYMFLVSWLETFEMRWDGRRIFTRKLKTEEEKLEALQKAERRAKDEDYMRQDAEMAREELRDKRVGALEDLSWIDMKVNVDSKVE